MKLSAPNFYPGLRVTAGTVVANSTNALGATRTATGGIDNLVAVDGGTLDLNGIGQTIGGLADGGQATGVVRNDGAAACTLTVGEWGSSSSFAGTLADGASALALAKTGAGTLFLNGSNTYGGGTLVSGGALGGTGSVAGTVTVAAGGALAPGASAGVFTVNGDVDFASGSALAVEIDGVAAGTQYDQLAVNGAVDLGGATLDVALGAAPVAGHPYVIVVNDGTDPVEGAFDGIVDGGTVSAAYDGRVYSFVVRYNDPATAGGNDVTLRLWIGTFIQIK